MIVLISRVTNEIGYRESDQWNRGHETRCVKINFSGLSLNSNLGRLTGKVVSFAGILRQMEPRPQVC